ncbi:hypothetical protein M501DRAFT_500563 [Patellaria atrata CBS 101060]|uniref:Uncharacterized protein n=1 Tax=Patellaria atrata CBS 101060 TaxID=1346257 RepID=A0A9P4S3K7_9PEZI|nr:hypothetical protein M501DRAFT_500563 [Patellaria atrata CBS 101060]
MVHLLPQMGPEIWGQVAPSGIRPPGFSMVPSGFATRLLTRGLWQTVAEMFFISYWKNSGCSVCNLCDSFVNGFPLRISHAHNHGCTVQELLKMSGDISL